MTQITIQETLSATDLLSEEQTWMSAFADGESVLPAHGFKETLALSHQYYQYQLIRQTLRGHHITSSTETISWHQTQFSRLWARVDAQATVQDV